MVKAFNKFCTAPYYFKRTYTSERDQWFLKVIASGLKIFKNCSNVEVFKNVFGTVIKNFLNRNVKSFES